MSTINKDELCPLLSPLAVTADRRLFSVDHYGSAKKAYIPQTLSEHRAFREEIIRRIKLAAGLNPMINLPKNTPQVSAPKIWENVLIYDVEIETLPGLRLTGNFFVPQNNDKKLPALLCPHGHWQKGRVHHDERGGVVMRCMQFARLGFAVFAYDMVGYNDCNDLIHYFKNQLKDHADLYGVSTFGLQTVNSMRAVDFLCERPEVDHTRIGCTGASGGASQTWFIAALDRRIKAIAPVCMLSSSFHGGCDCEAGALLRMTGIDNFDILASLAPMPMLLPSVNGDWTNSNPIYEIPKLKEVYKLYNAEDKIENFHRIDRHNYNQNTREYVYAWFVKQFYGEDRGIKINEENIPVPPPEMLWHKGVQPEAPSAEHVRATVDKLAAVITANALDFNNDFTAWQNDRREVLREMISSDFATKDVAVQYGNVKWDIDGGIACPEVLMRREIGDTVGNIYFCPTEKKSEKAFLFVLPATYRDVISDGRFYNEIKYFIQKGMYGCAVELFGNPDQEKMLEMYLRRPEERTCHAAFNPSIFSMRVQDIITAYTRMRERGLHEVVIYAPAESAPEALAACALLNTPEAVIDLEGLDENIWQAPLKHQVLIHKTGGLAGLVLINALRQMTYCNVPEYLQTKIAMTNCQTKDSFTAIS
ncbi:MAG: acetylxylan esterase [Lentisphaeria bacterium]|nr:acetylxylan esterase [Lentisphaeria bacterium]